MGPKTKSILLIVFTLLTGIGIGMWISGRMLESRLETMRNLNTPRGFHTVLFEGVELNETQQSYVDSLFKARIPQMRSKMREMAEFRKKRDGTGP